MPSITITVDPVLYLAACTVIAGLILAGYWCGRADRRDGRVLGGIRENDARFEQMRAVRERGTRRLTEALATLHTLSLPVMDAKPRWVTAELVDDTPESPPVPDSDREVEPGDDDYPPERAAFGAGRLPVEAPRGDENENLSGWRINPPPEPGRHRIEPDNRTRNLAAAVGRVSPPGAAA